MTDPTFNSLQVRRDTAGAVEDLLILDSVAELPDNGAGLSFTNNSAVEGLQFVLGRLSARRVDVSSVRMDLAVARDPTLSAGDDTPPLVSLVSGASGLSVNTAAGSTLAVGGALTVGGAATLGGGLSVTGAISVTGTVDGRDISADGARLDAHLADTNNPHATTAAQLGVPVSLAGVRNPGGDIALVVSGGLTVTPDDANNRITIGETHSARTDNPHATTAAQVGALPSAGGTLSGNLGIGGNLGVDGKAGIGTAASDARLTVRTTGNYDGDTLRIEARAEPSAYYLNLRSRVTSSNVRWVFDQVNSLNRYNDVLAFNAGNVGIGTDEPQARLHVAGVVRATTFESTNPNRHRMYPDNPVVYQDIFDAVNRGVIRKLGNPQYNDSSYSVNPWYERRIIMFGSNNEADGNGALVTIPDGYDTVWVRVLGDRWTVIKAYFTDTGEDLGLWAGGFRAANCYCPDGSLSDGTFHVRDNGNRTGHQWLPIPARRSGPLALVPKPNTAESFWVSGIAFSKNPWAHATQSAVGYHWASNGGTAIKWNTHDWNGDILAEIEKKTNPELKVPVVPSGRDKLLYLVEHNNNWNGTMFNGITVNNQPIERFLSTYDNPFARHWNSKLYMRYIAARIPANLIPAGSRWLNVRVNMNTQGHSIHFREIGTHDMETPY